MTVSEAYSYIDEIGKRGSVPGLDSIFSMLERIGNPQKDIKAVHVTGTNGKGSFCAMLGSVFTKKGYKTGVFSSPHLIDIRECISIDGEMISRDEFARLASRLSPISEGLENPLTQFEFMTALCLEYFREKQVDLAVIEVGMGGRLDATNVFESPLLSVITGISADHTSWLGSSLTDIAREKSGIIKKGCPVYYGGRPDGIGEDAEAIKVAELIKDRAKEENAPFFMMNEAPTVISASVEKTEFLYKGNRYITSLTGKYQAENAAKVIDCVEILNESGICHITADEINDALSNLKRQARFEVVSVNPAVIYDGGHNPECATALCESVVSCFGEKKPDFIMGVLADKDYTKMAEIIAPHVKKVYTITPNNPRALDSHALWETFVKKGICAYDCVDYKTALEKWGENGKNDLVVTGSLYSYGDFIAEFNKTYL